MPDDPHQPDLDTMRRRNHRIFHAEGWTDAAGVFHPSRVDPHCPVRVGDLAPA